MSKAKYQVQSYCIGITTKVLTVILVKGPEPKTRGYTQSQVILWPQYSLCKVSASYISEASQHFLNLARKSVDSALVF